MHYIREDVLCAYVLSRLQYWSQQAQQNEEKLLKRLMGATDRERNAAKTLYNRLFMKMYEDWSAGRIAEYNFNMLSEKYQTEQQELDAKIQQLRTSMEADQQSVQDAEKWIELIRRYTNITELTADLLNALIEKVVVHEATKNADGNRVQEVEIYYRFIGKIE